MAPAKGRGRPAKKTAEAKTDETSAASAKSPAKSPVAENGAKKGRGRPAGKVTKAAKSSASAKMSPKAAKAKKESAPVVKVANPTKRKAEDEVPDAAPPAKSPKTENAKAAGGRGRPKKTGDAAAKKPAAKSPAAKKGGRGRKPAAESEVLENAQINGSPITINMNVVVDGKEVAKKTVKVTKKRVVETETEALPPKKRGRQTVKEDVEPVKKSSKAVPKEKKEKPETKPKLNKFHTDYGSIDFSFPSDKEFNFKISSWNVAGLRAWIEKNGLEFFNYEKPDILCLQETKCTEDQLPEAAKHIKGYHPYWLCMPGGHAGIAIYSKIMPHNIEYGIGDADFDSEGRLLTAEYEKFYLVCTYVPNAGRKLVTLDKRLRWNKLFEAHLKKLDAKKPVILAGDLNVAHEEIDLTNPKTNKRNAGFTQEERDGMTDMLNLGFVDTFRHLYPEQEKAYTFWSYMGNARAKNVGWRLDYFIASERIVGKVVDNVIRSDVMGSDHCPITLFLKL